jgi:hypothetical protein
MRRWTASRLRVYGSHPTVTIHRENDCGSRRSAACGARVKHTALAQPLSDVSLPFSLAVLVTRRELKQLLRHHEQRKLK